MHKRLETQHGQLSVQERTLTEVRRALEKAGVEFIAENGGGVRGSDEEIIGEENTPQWRRDLGDNNFSSTRSGKCTFRGPSIGATEARSTMNGSSLDLAKVSAPIKSPPCV
jgi:hypothetical protein